MDIDIELKIIRDTYQMISSVDKTGQVRIMNWLNQKILAQPQPIIENVLVSSNSKSRPISQKSNYSLPVLSQLIHSSLLKNDQERCLLIALYTQGQTVEFSSRQISDTSLAIGWHFSNLTRTLTFLTQKSAAPFIQIDKKGHSKQAQRIFSFSNSGLLLAENLWQKALRGQGL